ncbi:sodium/proline symporter PutP [endosymbiont of Riftia pachyptila]|uniref:Sodium/proline symporter n=1 Tax=endosymbiont of Riftia pachyptila (vent Ph05) TaxID=1048808 RepID=G2DCT0_9GAMM|nr:sodium/proline symporter PutP [endosymbiont of Riftia pachyptila]EGV51587.1 sodium/proline symporter [endosymbiont of Riftia pachyptila (vent Ph05)]
MGETAELAIGATFLVYLLLMLAIGFWAWRRTSNLSDFVLGGRSLGSWVTALSASASDMSGWLLLGLPGYAYLSGLESLWLAAGLAVGTWLNWRLVAGRLRIASEQAGNALTLPEYLSNRFNDESGLIRIISAFFILLFFLFYTSSGLVAGGKLFESVFGLPYVWAVAAGALTVILYTTFGGFIAVSWTDLLQGLLMLAALLAVPLIALGELGGVAEALSRLEQRNPHLLDPFSDNSGAPLGWITIVSLAAWGLGYFGQPHILARFKAIRSVRQLPLARRIAMSWVVLSLIAASLVGLVGVPSFDQPLADAERVFIELVGLLFHPLIAGICLAAILAAIMSTADSQLLVASSAFTEDLYRVLWRRQASERELVLVGRLAVVGIAAAAFLLALDPDSQVLDLVAYAWAGFGAAFGPVVVFSLYWSRMSRNGVLAGIIAGGVTVVLWKQLQGGIFDLYEIVPGILVATLAILLVSRLERPAGVE